MASSSAYPQAEAAVRIDPEADEAAVKNCKDIHQAAKEGNVGAVRHFLRVDPESLERKGEESRTPLHLAVLEGRDEVVALLLRSGASAEAKDTYGLTALRFAAGKGHAAVVELLISAGATVDAADNDGRAREVEALMSAGATVDAADMNSTTVLHLAAQRGHAAVVEQLLSAGATVDAADEHGNTALHEAADKGHAAVVEQLISAGATVDAASDNGRAVVEHLISAGVTVDAAERNHGRTALHFATRSGHPAVVQQLISAGARVDAAVMNGETALHRAAGEGHTAVVQQLISAGANVDAASRRGRTALHRAALEGHAAVVQQLISAGATVDAAGWDGQTPYDLAEVEGHRQVMGLLRPVFVALLSGRSCRCDSSQERTVLELKEEAEKKLGVKIKHIIGQNQEPLDESMELAAAHIVPGNTLTAVISEDALEEGHPEAQAPSQPADPSMPEDGVEIKDFGHGIRLMAQQAIFEGFDPQIEVLENWSDLKEVSALEQALPAGHVPLARLLRLTPEDRTFPAPVKVQLPMCAGASTLWRSTTTGWEKVHSVIFDDCCATVMLDHFCDLVITGERVPLKGLGFLHPQGGHAQIVVMHVGCNFCQRGLELLCSDDDALKRLCRCGPSLQLGTYRHDEELEIYQAGKKSTMKILFDRLPLPCRVYAQSGLQFDVEIQGQNHHFEFEVPIRSATPAPQLAPSPHPSSTAGSASQAPAVAGAVGSSGVPNPTASSAASTDMRSAASQQGHLLLSGRFNSNEIIEYMKTVKKQLEARNVPVFMVEATVGQSFADLTRIGLWRAKGMITFCTSEYGAYTGVGYETFHELEFAHDHQLPLFPIRLCEQWPPAPQNNERGICQNQLVFKNGLVYIDDRQMNKAQHVADQIAESVARMGIFRTKLQL